MDDIFKAIVGAIVLVIGGVLVIAAGGAVGAYALAGALGAGKALSVTAGIVGAVAVPVAAGKTYEAVKKAKREKKKREWAKIAAQQAANYKPPAPAPAPAPKTAPAANEAAAALGSDAPPVFIEALTKMKELDPEERRKYLDRLRDAFPTEVETLHKYDEQMALAHKTAPLKKITLKQSKPPA